MTATTKPVDQAFAYIDDSHTVDQCQDQIDFLRQHISKLEEMLQRWVDMSGTIELTIDEDRADVDLLAFQTSRLLSVIQGENAGGEG